MRSLPGEKEESCGYLSWRTCRPRRFRSVAAGEGGNELVLDCVQRKQVWTLAQDGLDGEHVGDSAQRRLERVGLHARGPAAEIGERPLEQRVVSGDAGLEPVDRALHRLRCAWLEQQREVQPVCVGVLNDGFERAVQDLPEPAGRCSSQFELAPEGELLAETVADDRRQQVILGGEVVEDQAFGYTRAPGDHFGSGGVKSCLAEYPLGSLQNCRGGRGFHLRVESAASW